MNKGIQLASDLKYYSDYSKFLDEEGRTETWSESVSRIMDMHRQKFAKQIKANAELARAIDFAQEAYTNKEVLGSQRALQWGGAPLLKHEFRSYNCLGGYIDRIESFQEALYLLLCGCGVGFSVQWHHIAKLPTLQARDGEAKTFVILDNIEAWADAAGALIASYINPEFKTSFPNFQGHRIAFDYSMIRPKGSKISGGFKAPGPDGLRASLIKIEELLDRFTRGQNSISFKPIIAYDIVMHMSDAVLSGGVRRSATICLFSPDDEEMLKAKTGNWMEENPQRARSNNSAVLVRDETTKEQFSSLFNSVKEYGEPGFFFVSHKDIVTNPCCEIGFWPQTEEGESGWSACNLTEINGAHCTSSTKFYEACRAAAIIGTLQAGYTNFKYVNTATKKIIEREALLGVSITGWCNNPEVLFDEDFQREGAEIIKITNKVISKMLGINQAARTTCVKPSGNASVLLGTASGIHGEHASRYFRNMQMNKSIDVAKIFAEHNPDMVENSVWNPSGTDWVLSIPIEAPAHSLFKRHLIGINQLELVRLVQNNWVENGTNSAICVNPLVRHNVSNTIQVLDWEEAEDYIYKYREDFAGVSLLGVTGDKDYAQAPFTEVFTKEQLLEFYGDAALFASGLIVDGMHVFSNDLWWACREAIKEPYNSLTCEQHDWRRRAIKFADNYFGGDMGAMSYCLKDIYNYHKWCKINQNLVDIDWEKENITPNYVEIDTMASAACVGGMCEI